MFEGFSEQPKRHMLFDIRTFGPQAGDRQLSGIRRHMEWIGRHEWPARVVIVVKDSIVPVPRLA
jgi:hypothetical protein